MYISEGHPQDPGIGALPLCTPIRANDVQGRIVGAAQIILTTHYLEEAEQLCRSIAIIDEGNIIENTTMKKLLAELDSQVFIFDAATEIDNELELGLEHVNFRSLDSHSFEVTITAGRSINEIFGSLDRLGIQIKSMRNKTNRLEQLFLSKLHAVAK